MPVRVAFAVMVIDAVTVPLRLCVELAVHVAAAVVVRLTLTLRVSVVDAVGLRLARAELVPEPVLVVDRDPRDDTDPVLLVVDDGVPETVRLRTAETLPDPERDGDAVGVLVGAAERDPDGDLEPTGDCVEEALVDGDRVVDRVYAVLRLVVMLVVSAALAVGCREGPACGLG